MRGWLVGAVLCLTGCGWKGGIVESGPAYPGATPSTSFQTWISGGSLHFFASEQIEGGILLTFHSTSSFSIGWECLGKASISLFADGKYVPTGGVSYNGDIVQEHLEESVGTSLPRSSIELLAGATEIHGETCGERFKFKPKQINKFREFYALLPAPAPPTPPAEEEVEPTTDPEPAEPDAPLRP
jgi:hypothetical protein